jgi:outer membrane protein TolC
MKTLLIYLNLFFLISSLYSQDSLFNYLEIAAKNNPVVLQKFNEYQATLQKVPQVGSLPDPELNVGVFLSPMELVSGNQVADIRLMQMFPWFGVLKNAKDEMSLMAKAKYELFRDAKLQVFYDVQRTWYNLYKVQQNIYISEKNIEILQTLERLTLVKFKSAPTGGGNPAPSSGNATNSGYKNTSFGSSGMNAMGGNNQSATPNQQSTSMQSNAMGSSSGGSGLADLYRIQMDIGELDNNISLLKNQQSTIMARFNSYLNRPVKTMVALPDTLIPDSLGISLIAASDCMLANNPMLDMLQYEQQSIDARKKMVTRMGYPMVGLGVNYSLINKSDMSTSAMNGKDMIMPMVTVTLPIYRRKYKAMQTEADLMKAATEQGYQDTANSLQTEYYEAMQLYQDAERRMKLYENQSLLAKKSLDIMIKSFSVSSSNLTDVLRIRQQMLDYEFKQVEALVDYNTAVAWLKRLMANN